MSDDEPRGNIRVDGSPVQIHKSDLAALNMIADSLQEWFEENRITKPQGMAAMMLLASRCIDEIDDHTFQLQSVTILMRLMVGQYEMIEETMQ